ncbi:unnamed protein product [Paramecium sonneborni]|uniref:Uncharacterized protein n=1 Tax=Paramecium sonneborni TaxID=65129 RepID=A0A8S1KGT5_9CILI|nr:unnamed protein product [Paramecium sonneborni]
MYQPKEMKEFHDNQISKEWQTVWKLREKDFVSHFFVSKSGNLVAFVIEGKKVYVISLLTKKIIFEMTFVKFQIYDLQFTFDEKKICITQEESKCLRIIDLSTRCELCYKLPQSFLPLDCYILIEQQKKIYLYQNDALKLIDLNEENQELLIQFNGEYRILQKTTLDYIINIAFLNQLHVMYLKNDFCKYKQKYLEVNKIIHFAETNKLLSIITFENTYQIFLKNLQCKRVLRKFTNIQLQNICDIKYSQNKKYLFLNNGNFLLRWNITTSKLSRLSVQNNIFEKIWTGGKNEIFILNSKNSIQKAQCDF